MEGVRLVAFLGTGDYQPTSYHDAEQPHRVVRTRYCVRALAELVDAREIVIFATAEARSKHGAGLAAALAEASLPSPRWETVPRGQDDRELWSLFEVLVRALRAPGAPHVVLDVTHGFRAQPFFAAAAVAFVRALQGDEGARSMSVRYGAFDAKSEDDRTPIWDLTPFLDVLEWTTALRTFLSTGTSEEVAALAAPLGSALARDWAQGGRQGDRPSLDRLAAALREFGDDLTALRTGSLLLGASPFDGSGSAATRLAQAAAALTDPVRRQVPALAEVLEQVGAMAEPLRTSTLDGDEGRRALLALARLYVRLKRPAAAAAILREASVCWYSEPSGNRPGDTAMSEKARRDAEQRWMDTVGLRSRHALIADVRNDLLHAGFRTGPRRPQRLSQQLEECLLAAASLTPPEKPLARDASDMGAFANVSNHPSASWDEVQRLAAQALCGTAEIRDVAFPHVDPDTTAEELRSAAWSLAEEVGKAGATHAMVQGEFVMTTLVVQELQGRGVRCHAATTRRDVRDLGDGRREQAFRFVRFRSYPPLVS